MKKTFADNRILLKILSGLIAIILWIAITYTEDPVITQALTGISVSFEGEQQLENNGLTIVNRKSQPDISVIVRGTRSSVISALDSITASVDVSEIKTAGSSVLPIKYSYPTSSVTLVKSRQTEMTVETEKIVTRSIPVRIETENADKNTEFIVKSECAADKVKVRGAESAVYNISYGLAEVDVSGVTRTSMQDYTYNFYDEKNNKLSDENIIYRSHNTLTVENTVYKKVSVPVEISADDETLEMYSMTVKSQSASNVDVGVEDGTSVTAIKAVVRREEGKTEYETELIVPEGVYVPEKNRKVTAVCQFEPKILTEITVPVTVKNAPEGVNITIEPKEIKVSVKGSESTVGSGKITAELDAAGVTADGLVPVKVTAVGDITVVGSYSVEAKINQ